jgi:hypothetical protein
LHITWTLKATWMQSKEVYSVEVHP